MRRPIDIMCGKSDSTENDSGNQMNAKMNFDENESNKNNTINTMTSNLGILRFILPPPIKSQSAPSSPRRHSHRSKRVANNNNKKKNNNSSNIDTETINSINNHNNNTNSHRRHQSTNSSMSHSINSVVNSSDSVLDINSNITFKHRDSLEDSSNSDSSDKTDMDNDKGSNPFLRSDSVFSVEDSGFSSSNCLSDDKDDISVNTSFDYDHNNEINAKRDSLISVQHPFSLSSLTDRTRVRTFSIDSTSSDLSDSNTLAITSKLSTSLPLTCIFNNNPISLNKNNDIQLSTSDQTNLSNIGVVKRRSFRNRSGRSSTKSTSNACRDDSDDNNIDNVTTISPLQPDHNSESDTDNDYDYETDNDHNNNCADVPCKNLSSRLDTAIPFRYADLFQSHGLITLFACIFYTFFLLFVFGIVALSWGVLKHFVNKSDLKDLKESMLEHRRRRDIVATHTTVQEGGS